MTGAACCRVRGPGRCRTCIPQLGAAVEQHSTFFRSAGRGCCGRCTRSAVWCSTATAPRRPAPRSATTTSTSRASTLKGRRYHALNPDVFYWAHSTFFVGTIIVAERFCGGITEAEKRQLFDEHVEWYRMYGMSMRPVPKTWEDFQVYWDHMCRNVLENNKAARDVLDLDDYQTAVRCDGCPTGCGADAATRGRAVLASGCTVGLYDPPVRDLMGFTWSRRDEWLHRRFGSVVRIVVLAAAQTRRACIRARVRAGTARRAGSRPTRRCRRRRRAICRRSTSAATRCTTARSLTSTAPCVAGPHRAVEIAHLTTVLRIGEPARLHGRIPAEHAAGVTGEAQPVLEVGAGAQPRVAERECPPATADEHRASRRLP